MKPFKAIAAMSENRVIGCCGSIPWHLPEDFKFFKKTTMGHILVMGRTTYESIGHPLPGRETIVLSRTQKTFLGTKTVSSLDALDFSNENRDVFICGGSQIYGQFLPLCSELYLTVVKRTVEGDAYFPTFEHLFSSTPETLLENDDFRIFHFTR